jgi:hypothetical protein
VCNRVPTEDAIMRDDSFKFGTEAWHELVYQTLIRIWGQQSCSNSDHWPGVLCRLLRDGGGEGVNKRCSMAPYVDSAVAKLAELFRHSAPPNAAYCVWAAFPKLTREHAALLAQSLIQAQAEMAEAAL